ncbi:MAG: transcription termination/antitermination protein NusA, partial [Lachnospiraceae bacterium]
VDQLGGEKIDIVSWDENPGNFIQNALSPARIIAVFADPMEKTAKVVVPNYQLSLAIGREGQNARLAARLTGYKIDIKDEDQAKVTPGFRYEDYMDSDEEEVEYVNSDGYLVDENGELLLDENGEPIPADMEEGYEGEAPAEEAPEEGAPAEDAPAKEDAPSEDAPAEDAPAGENTPEA